MACTTTTNNFKLEAVNLYFGGEGKSCVTPVAGLAGGEYFTLSTPNDKFYVWFNLDAGSVDPAPAGYTEIEVAIATGHTVSDVITACKTAIELSGEFLVYESTDGLSFEVECFDIGAVLESVAAGTSGFTVAQSKTGFGGSLGRTKSGIEFTTEVTMKDILSNQTGETPLDTFATGVSVSVSADIMETTPERIKSIIGEGYGSYKTVGSDDIVGFGTSKLYQSAFGFAGKLIGHPVRLPDTDRSGDFVIWKTVPVPSSITYSGTDEQVVNIDFKALIDSTKSSEVNLASIMGDWKKDLR